MADNAPFKSDGINTVFLSAADEVTYSGDVCKVQLIRMVTVSGAEGAKVVVDIIPGVDYIHNGVVLTPDSTAGPMTMRRVYDGTSALVAVDKPVMAVATGHGKSIVMPYAASAEKWHYAPPALGMVTTAQVLAQQAPGAGKYLHVTGMQVWNTHQTIATELILRDGAAGAVLWRGWAQFTGGGAAPFFAVDIYGSANTALYLEEVTATPASAPYGGVLWNLQGFIDKD